MKKHDLKKKHLNVQEGPALYFSAVLLFMSEDRTKTYW